MTELSSDSVASPTGSGKLAESTALAIEHEIFLRGWPVGEVLGSEIELLKRFSVSRAVLREAIRLLEHHGVARMRSGPGGGLVVTAPEADAIVRGAFLYLRYRSATSMDVFQVRQALELVNVQIAAERINETGVTRLRAALENEVQRQTRLAHVGASDVHIAIAELTENPVMPLFLRVLTKLTADLSPVQPRPPSRESQLEVRHAHEAIVEAVVSGDRALARHRMNTHLVAMARWLDC